MGELKLCACVGPQNGELYCPCAMRHKGLEFESFRCEWTQDEKDAMQKVLEHIFDPSNKNPQVTNRDRTNKC